MFSPILAIWNIGPMEIVIIIVVLLLLFGGRLPEVARSMGKGIVEFKKGLKEVKSDIEDVDKTVSNNDTSNTPVG